MAKDDLNTLLKTRDGVTMVIVTHDYELADRTDDVLRLENGKLDKRKSKTIN